VSRVTVIGTRASSYDLVSVLGGNVANPWHLFGSAVYFNHVFWGSVQLSPHTLMHRDWESWDEAMTNGPGKGRNTLQKGFHAVDKAGRQAVKVISNHLK
jgi:hypothetical protein